MYIAALRVYRNVFKRAVYRLIPSAEKSALGSHDRRRKRYRYIFKHGTICITCENRSELLTNVKTCNFDFQILYRRVFKRFEYTERINLCPLPSIVPAKPASPRFIQLSSLAVNDVSDTSRL